MASYRRIDVKPIAGALGAEISTVDLGNLDDETFKEIEAAWLEHLVVFFREQTITPEQQIAFARRFGEIHHHPFMKGMDDHPEILEIVKEEGDTKAFGEVWHTDQMFNPKPAKATILYAKETPDAGGDTLFANMYLAYDTLSDPMKATARGVKTWNVGDRKKLSRKTDRLHARRPLRRQREDGRQAARPRRPADRMPRIRSCAPIPRPAARRSTSAITRKRSTGSRHAEARPILDFLMTHAVQPEFTCRFRWEVDSLAIWDNRCTQHRALNDYPGKRRRMHRITIAGDAPF